MIRPLAILLALSAAACGSESAVVICETGTALACRCDDGRPGTSQCVGGDQFDACDCDGGTGGGISMSSSSTASGPGGSGGSGGCANDLSNIGVDDFTISLTLATTQSGQVAVVNQRDLCAQEMFWDLRVSNGLLEMETSDSTSGADYVASFSSASVNDGAEHEIVVKRVAQELSMQMDGAPIGGGVSPASFGALPALAEGVDICDDDSSFFALSGTLKDVCVTSP